MTHDVTAGSRITVPEPGAAYAGSALERAHGEPERAEPVEHVEPGDARADDDGVEGIHSSI